MFGFYVAIFFEIVLAGFVIWGFKHEEKFISFEEKLGASLNARRTARKAAKKTFNVTYNRTLRAQKLTEPNNDCVSRQTAQTGKVRTHG